MDIKYIKKRVRIHRGKTVTLNDLPQYSIALDGYVQGPIVDMENHRLSLDHHGNCIRMFTSATCKQAFDAVMLAEDSFEKYTVYINDVDLDSALATFCIINAKYINSWLKSIEKNKNDKGSRYFLRLKELVRDVNDLDAHGPAYNISRLPSDEPHKFIQWIEYPIMKAQQSGDYYNADLYSLLQQELERINSYIKEGESFKTAKFNKNKSKKSFTVVRKQDNYGLFCMPNYSGFFEMYKFGYNAGVLFKSQTGDTYKYTIFKKSDLVCFPVKKILTNLNELEPGWGGGSQIGGSPRNSDGSGSKLTPDEVWNVIVSTVENSFSGKKLLTS